MTTQSVQAAAALRMENAPELTAEIYTDENAALEFLENRHWPYGAECPFCGMPIPYRCSSSRFGRMKCRSQECAKTFSVFSVSPMHSTKAPATAWTKMIACTDAGLSARQAATLSGVTDKTAWQMAQKLKQWQALLDARKV